MSPDPTKQLTIDLPYEPNPSRVPPHGCWYHVPNGNVLVLTFRCPQCASERNILPSSLSPLSTFFCSCPCGLHRVLRLVDYPPSKLSS